MSPGMVTSPLPGKHFPVSGNPFGEEFFFSPQDPVLEKDLPWFNLRQFPLVPVKQPTFSPLCLGNHNFITLDLHSFGDLWTVFKVVL